ncbi:MAG TPA: hypothetical protein VMM81_03790 [Acidimicrobiia bacterium]|nr:hypothetical protein [Acidimicrobiia bacterium]
MRRTFSLLAALTLAASACAYESSGTTTTTFIEPEDLPPALGPADIELSDQRVDGSFFVVDLVSMPAAGWVVARVDEAGAPGEVIGISELLSIGVIELVAVPFFVPISEDTPVHVSIHVDVDRDGRFTYQPPDSFIDEIAVRESGEPASDRAVISLLPPLAPTEIFVEDQATDGTFVGDIAVVLPAPGFVVVHADEGGSLGPVLGFSTLIPAGGSEGIEVVLEPPLALTGVVYVAVYIDRNADLEFGPGEDADEVGVWDDGALAIVPVTLTVPDRAPAVVEVSDQTGSGGSVAVASVQLPYAGFIEVLTDDDGEPGTRIGVSDLLDAGSHEDVEIALATNRTSSATLWVRLWVDLDGSGELSVGDAIALVAVGGEPAQATFSFTVQ